MLPVPQNTRCLILARSATHNQGSESLERQLEVMRTFAQKQGLSCVGEIRLEGVAAMPPHVLDELLHRKSVNNDFDVLVISDLSRLGRRSMEIGCLLTKLADARITLMSATDGISLDADSGLPNFLSYSVRLFAIEADAKARSEASKAGWARRKQGKNGGVR